MMKKIICTILVTLYAVLAFGQTDNNRDTIIIKHCNGWQNDVDTIITTRHFNKVLAGTTVLPRSVLYMHSVFGVYLENIKLTNCNNDEGYYEVETKINSVLLTDSTLTVEFDFMSNCCSDFLCYLGVENDEILKLDFIEYGDDCACFCPFKLKYFIGIDKEFENDFSRLKYIMIGNAKVELKNL